MYENKRDTQHTQFMIIKGTNTNTNVKKSLKKLTKNNSKTKNFPRKIKAVEVKAERKKKPFKRL